MQCLFFDFLKYFIISSFILEVINVLLLKTEIVNISVEGISPWELLHSITTCEHLPLFRYFVQHLQINEQHCDT